jgi:CNT family concentrative nucleoside transporter
LLGLIVLILFAWLSSANRRSVNWNLIMKGIALQVIIAVLVLKVPFVEDLFKVVSSAFVRVIKFTDDGVNFLFGQMGIGTVQGPLITFAVKVLPTIIFFSALVSLFYYWGILQKIVYGFAWLMKRFMKLSGAESLAAAGNVFLGQTEAPLLVKPYLPTMTKSEIMCLMTGGMATIAGGVLAAYVSFLGGDDPQQQAFFAKHLLTASIISAPAAIVAAKIIVPEREEINEKLSISKDKIGTNALEAIANGTTDGLRLAVNVGAMLLVFIAMMAFANYLLGKVGHYTGLNEMIAAGGTYAGLSFEFLLGYACRPVVWLMGVDWVDSIYVGELLGTKTILNEFVAYPRLGEMKEAGLLNQKSVVMSTYMLCGFANVASIGIQIGGIGALAPTRKGMLSQLGVRALIGGTIASLMTAVIVGMML